MCYIILIDLYMCMLNHSFIPGKNFIWLCYMSLLMWYWILFNSILLKMFVPILIRDIGLLFSYVVVSFPGVSLVAQTVNNLPAMQDTWDQFLGWKDPLEKEMTMHSNILAWETPWMEEPGGLQSLRSRRVGHNWATNTDACPFLAFSSVQSLSCVQLCDPYGL